MAITNNGYEVPTLAEVLTAIGTAQKAIFPGIVLDQSSPDQQLNALFGEVMITAYEVAAGIYNGMDPRTAAGIMLDRTCALTGVIRKLAGPSTVAVQFTGTQGVVVPVGTLLSASSVPQSEYRTIADAVIDSTGMALAVAESTTDGDEDILALTIDTIDTPKAGVTAVTNPAAGVNGQTRESDTELRKRRERVLSANSIALVDSVDSGIRAEDGVLDCRVFENYTSAVDGDGVSPHSILCVVEGGADQDIIDAIMENKSLGCGLDGSTAGIWFDQNGFTHPVNFERPTLIPIFIRVQVDNITAGIISDVESKLMAYITDLQDYSNPCVTATLGIGADIHASIFYAPLMGNTDYNVLDIKVDILTPAGLVTVPIDITELATFDVADIQVTL